MTELREVFEMTTNQVEPDVDAWRKQEGRQRKANRNKKVGAFAVAAAIGVAAAALILGSRGGENANTPANESPTATPVDTNPEEVAMGFLEDYGALDAGRAVTYLADDADISQLIASVGGATVVEESTEELRLLISLLEAQGYKQMVHSCEEVSSSAAGTNLRCTFDFHLLRSDLIGLGPFSGSSFDITVRDGAIVRASKTWGIEEFSPQLWEPFASWVSTAYPEDAAVMYVDDTYSGARLTEESIGLWERRTREYAEQEIAEVVSPEMVGIAESFMEARNAYDVEKAMSLLADDGATVRLMYDHAIDPELWTVRLDRDELALALEAERLYGVRYESFECRPAGVGEAQELIGSNPEGSFPAPIVCSYLMDNKLRQIHGFPPVESWFGIGIRDNRIHYLSFPWLNVSFPAGKPAEGGRFVRWLEAEHPEAGGPFDDGELFRTGGQELIHIFTPESIDLLADYLEEYERSVSG